MKKHVVLLSLLTLFFSVMAAANSQVTTSSEQSIKIVKGMFTEFAENKDMSVFDKYHAADFVLETNGVTYDRAAYKKLQARAGEKEKKLSIKYDDIFAEG